MPPHSSPPQFDLGSMIRSARKAKRMTQDDLAELLGYSQRWVSDLERGVVKHSRPGTLKRVAEILDIDVPELMLAAGRVRNLTEGDRLGAEIDLAPDEADMVFFQDYQGLSPEGKALIRRMIADAKVLYGAKRIDDEESDQGRP